MTTEKSRAQRVFRKHFKATKDRSEAHNRTLDELAGKYAGTDESGSRRRAVSEYLRPRKIGKPARKASPGSVSHGTMRDEDLIPAFMSVLDHCWPVKAKALRASHRNIFRWLAAGAPSYSYKSKAGQNFDLSLSDFVNESLFNALDQCAPRGHYFGAHPGDGSDYGFWSNYD